MALAAIRQRLNDSDAFNLLGLLPPNESMRWIYEPDGTPTSALVIGYWGGQNVIAFHSRKHVTPNAAPKLKYATGSRATSNHQLRTSEDIIEMSLLSPFKYVKGHSKSEKWRVSCLIKYYFLMSSKLDGSTFGDLEDMAKKFEHLLLVIKEKQAGEKEGAGKEEQVIEESEEEVSDASSTGIKTRSTRDRQKSQRPSPRKLRGGNKVAPTDYERLKDVLQDHNELHLLDNIPTAEEMTFEDQDAIPTALARKLFVGYYSGSGESIYAYMRYTGNFHEIRFQRGEGGKEQHVPCDLFMKQQVIHPFNKTFPKGGLNADGEDKARATLMVKWYFIEQGLAKDCVLKQTKRFPDRFRLALAYIAQRMGKAAKRPEPPVPPEIDESDIQSRLDSQASPTSPVKGASTGRRKSIHQQPTPSDDSASPSERTQGKKRTAVEAGLDSLERNIAKDRALTRQMNEMDDRLEIHELQLRALRRQREELDKERKEVRKDLKRDSLAFAASADDS